MGQSLHNNNYGFYYFVVDNRSFLIDKPVCCFFCGKSISKPMNWKDRTDSDRWIITLRPRQNGRRFPDDIFKCIFLNENVWISSKISLKLVPKVRINSIPALVQMMAWSRPGDKPLSEPMMGNSLTHAYMCHSASMSYWHSPSYLELSYDWAFIRFLWLWRDIAAWKRSPHYWPFVFFVVTLN